MAEKKKSSLISHGIAAQNRKARFDYTIKDTLEAGLVLRGPEVKSLRHGRATITEAWAGERDGEIYLNNCYIPEYQAGVLSRFEPRAPRKLLLHKKQISKLLDAVSRDGHTLVPLDIHFNEKGVGGTRPISGTPSPTGIGRATRRVSCAIAGSRHATRTRFRSASA
jgi:SsrA-binding protein